MTRATPRASHSPAASLLVIAGLVSLCGCPQTAKGPDEPSGAQQVPDAKDAGATAPQPSDSSPPETDPPVGEALIPSALPELDAVQIDPDTGAPVVDVAEPDPDDPEAWDGSQVRGDDEEIDEREPSEPAPKPALSAEELKALAAKGILKHFPGITVYTKEKRIEVEAEICLRRSPSLELLACTPKGKTHESLLKLHLDPKDGPEHLATALILIGLEPTPQVNEFGEAIKLEKGQRVVVEVCWKAEATPPLDSSAPAAVDGWVSRRAEDLIWDKRSGAAMPPAGWVFTGSRQVKVPMPPDFKTEMEVYAASYTGNIAATFHDPDCVLDTPLIEGGDDTVYVPYQARIPERGTPVRVKIELMPADEHPVDEAPADEQPADEQPADEQPKEDGGK